MVTSLLVKIVDYNWLNVKESFGGYSGLLKKIWGLPQNDSITKTIHTEA